MTISNMAPLCGTSPSVIVPVVGRTGAASARSISPAVSLALAGSLSGTMPQPAQTEAEDQPVILSVRAITKRFPGVVALDDVSFDVQKGEVHGLVGENGAGKSTLVKIMSGVYTEFDGVMLLNGLPVSFRNTREAIDSGIAMIHQELNLVPELTVYENIFLGREHKTRLNTLDRRSMRRAAEELMARLGLDIDANRTIERLRVSQRQLVEIAKALSLDTSIIIMDEPTSALSDSEVEYLFGVVRGLREHDVAVVYISHRLDEVFAITDRVTVLRDGRVVGSAVTDEVSRREVISMMVGRDLESLYPKTPVELGDEVLRVEGLTYMQGRTKVLDDVSLTVRRGEIVGVAGLMGAGRTQLLEAIFGVYPPDSLRGSIVLNGREARFSSPQDAIREGLGLVAEDRKLQSLVLERSVTENTTLASLRLFMNRLRIISQGSEKRVVERVVDDLQIKTPTIDAMVANLSGGNQQKVVIGKFLLSEIVLFLLDEPTRGIDVGAKAEIYHLVGELAKGGTSFLLVSSEMPELLAVCDRIYVLCDGRLTGVFERESFDQEAIMEAATRFMEGDRSAAGPAAQGASL